MFKPSYNIDFDKNKLSGKTSWKSPSNIALIKYWGKKDLQTPMNPSLSLTLNDCHTITDVSYNFNSTGFKYEFYFENKLKPDFNKKLDIFFSRIIDYFPFLNKVFLKINSANTFPHSSGIASSASAFSSLALCIVDIEKSIYGLNDWYLTPNRPKGFRCDFNNKASFMSRLGSGSASRSVFGPAAIWGRTNSHANSNDWYSIPLKLPDFFFNYHDTILIVDESSKSVSSSAGHNLVENHQFKSNRINQANLNLKKLIKSIDKNDKNEFSKIVENEALTLHAMMLTSNPSFILFKPNTINIINKVWDFRKSNDTSLCFTLDAGANVHLLYHKNDYKPVQDFIKNELLSYCFNGKYINDKVGAGPEKINLK